MCRADKSGLFPGVIGNLGGLSAGEQHGQVGFRSTPVWAGWGDGAGGGSPARGLRLSLA